MAERRLDGSIINEPGFFNFGIMITPAMVKIGWILVALLFIYNGYQVLSQTYASSMEQMFGWLLIIGGPLVTRLVAEAIIVLFEMNENLRRLVRIEERRQ